MEEWPCFSLCNAISLFHAFHLNSRLLEHHALRAMYFSTLTQLCTLALNVSGESMKNEWKRAWELFLQSFGLMWLSNLLVLLKINSASTKSTQLWIITCFSNTDCLVGWLLSLLGYMCGSGTNRMEVVVYAASASKMACFWVFAHVTIINSVRISVKGNVIRLLL